MLEIVVTLRRNPVPYLTIAAAVILLVYRAEFVDAGHVDIPARRVRVHWPMLWKPLVATGMAVAF